MQFTSHELAKVIDEFHNNLKRIYEKVQFYEKDELEKRGGSNFALDISDNIFTFLTKYSRVLSEKENLFFRDELVEKVVNIQKEQNKKFSDFENLMQSVYSQKNGSHDSAFFYTPFSSWINECYKVFTLLYTDLLDRLDYKEVAEKKDEYIKLLNEAKLKTDNLTEFQVQIEKTKKELDDALIKVEKHNAIQDVRKIKDFYESYIKKTIVEKRINFGVYIGSFSVLLSILIYLFYNMEKVYPNNYLLIPKSILSISLIGFGSFFVNDFRKRYNITKHIVDEIEQKLSIIDAYASLIDTVKEFDEDTKKQYHQKILQNIVDTLLIIRQRGFLSKNLNQDNMTASATLIEQVNNLVKTITPSK